MGSDDHPFGIIVRKPGGQEAGKPRGWKAKIFNSSEIAVSISPQTLKLASHTVQSFSY
jgi:hypothetical protein